jgi:hypothetical protein
MMLRYCMFCFAKHGAQLRFTKKGRPYVTCRICYTRAFLHGMEALQGVAIAGDLIEGVLQQLEAGDAGAEWIHERTRALRAYVRATVNGAGLPEATVSPVPYLEGETKEKIA